MKNNWLWLLAAGLAGCGGQVSIAPEVALRHQYDAAFQNQVALLHASAVQVSATAATKGSPAVLLLDVRLPRDKPSRPDTLKQRVHKLAHLLVADLAHPDQYPALTAQVTERKSYFDASATSQSFIYPVSGLR